MGLSCRSHVAIAGLLFFLVGGLLLATVDEQAGMAAARAEGAASARRAPTHTGSRNGDGEVTRGRHTGADQATQCDQPSFRPTFPTPGTASDRRQRR